MENTSFFCLTDWEKEKWNTSKFTVVVTVGCRRGERPGQAA